MIIKILIFILLLSSCSNTEFKSRTLASESLNTQKTVIPDGLPKNFVFKEYVYNKNENLFYLIGQDQKLYSFDNQTKKLEIIKDSPEQLRGIKLIDSNKNKILLFNNENTIIFSQIQDSTLIITQEHPSKLKHLPIREVSVYNDQVLIHYSKNKPKNAVGYNFKNFLYSDLNVTHLNPLGFKPQDNAPGEFFSKLGYKENEIFQLTKEEYEKALRAHMNERLLFPQAVDILKFDKEKGWVTSFFNPYFNHVEYSQDLKKIIFTNKIEQTLGFYDGVNFKFVSEEKFSFTKLSQDEKFLAVASVDNGKVSIYDFNQTKLVYTFDVKENIRHLDFLPGGNLQVITEKGFIYEFKALPGGEFERKTVGNFGKNLARNLKLEFNKNGQISALDKNGQRIIAPDYQYCSYLLR